ncbi:transporter substrate-binding protein [Halalkalibacter nanhaiisediminis]|uniref:Transcriptional regulator with PAS, ATPase and Fis domain n=1 Tax=Halalkalibacter nanhaiisediminis TaxID=688079 RepID=A0A562QH65_9BACI|nr:transporter substrate-binding protein [Halalkalibacter nanhaiisediminis]TWI56112.1 transcriptional regulator with PAS, ATPase and Fis domain [Halalkalibacter nanhaiisediminis]
MDIKIGLLFSTTGTMSVTEEGQYKAALLAINEINDSGGIMGRKLTPVHRNICSDPLIAAKETESLLNEGINLLVGLYTSASRKSVLPVIDKYDCLLFYPTQYEGEEQHPNIFYCGPLPNQLLLDYIPWITQNLGKTFHLIGSDYIYPREMNKLIYQLTESNGGSVVNESYIPLGETMFSNEIKKIQQKRPDVIFSTLVGGSAVAFYKEYYKSNLQVPIASTITAETEVCALPTKYMVGHYSCFPYFNSIESKENKELKQKFKANYGTEMISSAMENAYNSVHLMAKALKIANCLDVHLIKKNIAGLTFQAPQGEIIFDQYNQHLWLHSRIGQVKDNGTFQIIWESNKPLKPLPFSVQSENLGYLDKNFEESLAENTQLIHELKKATSFFPHPIIFFDSSGMMLDIFDSNLKDFFKTEQFEFGLLVWTNKFLKNSGITKAFLEKEISFSVGSEHENQFLKDWITFGIPIKNKNKFYGVLGVFINNMSDFNLEFYSTLIHALQIVTQNCIDIIDKTKDSIFLYELLNDISNHFEQALLVKKGGNLLFKNNKAEQLINAKNELILNLYRENFDDITHFKRQSYMSESRKNFNVEIIPAHDYRYVYIKELEQNKRNLKKNQQKRSLLLEDIIGTNPRFLDAVSHAQTASKNSANVLILGESGTGKEVFARAIHNESSRKDKPFIAINCAAINENLLTSELFGYVEGAFTGAKKGGSPGKFEQANEGTLFLDEIGDTHPDLQATLLRVLQEKEITRVGGHKTIPIDVRIIAATNKNLSQEIAYKGSFRSDLYYRLNVFTIELIPLKDRKDDIHELANHFLLEFATKESGTIKIISNEALNCLKKHDWPGNIRELRNVIERAYYLSELEEEILIDHLPRSIYSSSIQEHTTLVQQDSIKSVEDIKRLNQIEEREKILNTLIEFKGNISKSSQHLGVSRNTLYKKIKEYNLNI